MKMRKSITAWEVIKIEVDKEVQEECGRQRGSSFMSSPMLKECLELTFRFLEFDYVIVFWCFIYLVYKYIIVYVY